MGVFATTSHLINNTGIEAEDVSVPIESLDGALVSTLGGTQAHTGALLSLLGADPSAPASGAVLYHKSGGVFVRFSNGTVATLSGGTITPAYTLDVTLTAAENLSLRDAVCVNSSGQVQKMISTSSAGALRGIVVEAGGIAAAASGAIRFAGPVTGFTGLTAGNTVFVHTTSGGITSTKPVLTVGGGQLAIIPLGVATSTTSILVMPGLVAVYARREYIANNGSISVTHHADGATRTRRPLAVMLPTVTTANATSGSTGYQIGTSTPVWGGQSFQLTAGGEITQFTVKFGANGGTPTGSMTYEIRTNNAGVPSSTILGSGTFTPTASAINTVNLATAINIAEATPYWLVLRPTNTQTSTNCWTLDYATSNPYGYPTAFSTNSGSSWTASASNDWVFSVTVRTAEEVLSLGRVSGGTRDMAVAYSTVTGVPSSTETRFVNVTGSTNDFICMVEI